MMETKLKDSGIPWIGLIPEHWTVLRHKNVFNCSKDLISDKWELTQLLSLTTKGIKGIAASQQTGKVPDSYETYQRVDKNDIVLCIFDLDCSAVFAGLSPMDGMISPAYKVLKTTAAGAPKYLDYYFQFIFNGRKFMFLSKNIRYSLTYDEFAGIQIPIPPLTEQERIAAWLDGKCGEIDELIDIEQQMISELEAYRQAVITETVFNGFVNTDYIRTTIDWIGKIPSKWQIRKIKFILRERKERSQNGLEEPLTMSQRLGLIPSKDFGDVANPAISFIGAKIVYPGDLVFNKLKAHLGVFAFSKHYGLVSPDYAVYFSDCACVRYYEYLFKTPIYISEFKKKITGVGSGLSRLYTNDLFSIDGLFPPISEQQEIADYLDSKCAEIGELIKVKQEKIESLRQYRQSLIFEAVTGKTKVN